MSEWIEWNGGECPVDGDVFVDVRHSDATVLLRTQAKGVNWQHNNKIYDIMAYRLHKSLDDATPEEWDDLRRISAITKQNETGVSQSDPKKWYDDTQKGDVQSKIITVCDNIKELLLAKNKKYGNSALQPKRIFSKASTIEQLLVRIDDKLSRIETTGLQGTDEDTLEDLIGYLILLKVAKNET